MASKTIKLSKFPNQNHKAKINFIPIKNHWDRLYHYSKYLTKSKEQKTINQSQQTIQKEIQDCTFHPYTHYSSEYTKKQASQDLNATIAERQVTWEGKKIDKIQRISKEQQERKYSECRFAPNIKRNESYLLTKQIPTVNLIRDPESFQFFLKRKMKIEQEKKIIDHQRAMTPGSGKVWKNKQTICKEYNLETSKLRIRTETNYNPHLNRLPPSNSPPRKKFTSNHSYTIITNSSKKEYDADPIEYIKAKDQLHSQLFDFHL